MSKAHMLCVTLIVCVWLCGVADTAMPVVSNATAEQRAGTTGAGTIVDITYDLEDADSDSVDITIEVSNDDGVTFDVPCVTFIGDVGRVSVGLGKTVEWLAGEDVPDIYWPDCRAKVSVDDVPVGGGGEIVVGLPGGATMTMVWIEPGTFTMGSPADEPGRGVGEGPQHGVTITQGFYLGKYELTQGQWESVMGTSPWLGQEYVQEDPNNPAVWISWYDMQALLDTLAAYGLGGFRLPTEAEWEYACRAGTTTRWSFGDDELQLTDYAWYYDNAWVAGERYGHAVGTKLPNPWGVYDMYGNVYEWVHDWWAQPYPSSSQVDPTGPATGDTHVIRGGYFFSYAQITRPAARFYVWPDYPDTPLGYSIGARLLRQGP